MSLTITTLLLILLVINIAYKLDIKTVEKKLTSNQYSTKDAFIKDVKKIFSNARTYNQPDTIYYRCANELEKYIQQFLNTLKDERNASEEQRVPGVSKKIKKKWPILD